MRESAIEKHLSRQVKLLGGRALKWSSPGNRGVPDRVVFVLGQVWFIELKNEIGVLSTLQIIMGRIIRQHTQNYAVLSSKQEVDQWIAKVQSLSQSTHQ